MTYEKADSDVGFFVGVSALKPTDDSGFEIRVESVGVTPVDAAHRLATCHRLQRHRALECRFVSIGINKELDVPVAGQLRPFIEVQRQFGRAGLERADAPVGDGRLADFERHPPGQRGFLRHHRQQVCAFADVAGDHAGDVIGGLGFDIQYVEVGLDIGLDQAPVDFDRMGAIHVAVADKHWHQKCPLIASSR